MTNFRCPGNKLHAKLNDGKLEVRCESRWCGKRPGVIVIHRFSIESGELIDTVRFRTPHQPSLGKETNGTH